MLRGPVRRLPVYVFIAISLILFVSRFRRFNNLPTIAQVQRPLSAWDKLPIRYPVQSMRPLPAGQPLDLPSVQFKFPKETAAEQEERKQRRSRVKETFQRGWKSYWELAKGNDELAPLSGGTKDHFGGWAATMVDSLDTLWIMGLKDEFKLAVAAVAEIDFGGTKLQEINVFETTIRYLGGLLGAYDLSGEAILLDKAVEVGEMLYCAFDTPNRMPVLRWHLHDAAASKYQVADSVVLLAEIGSLVLEFTRLSQITGNPKFYDAVSRVTDVMEESQKHTMLPGLWPILVNAAEMNFTKESTFTFGGMADSAYEYLPKTFALLGGQAAVYQRLYESAMETAVEKLLFRPMTPKNEDILISGTVRVRLKDRPDYVGPGTKQKIAQLVPEGQHLSCFVGGMFALGGKLFSRSDDMVIAEKLVRGCIYTYKAFPSGIMPELFHMVPCEKDVNCAWDEATWKQNVVATLQLPQDADPSTAIVKERFPQGFTAITDRRYALRPEAIESVFLLYRMTGKQDLPDAAWEMFTNIQKHTKTDLANAALADVTFQDRAPPQLDSMESFWFAETLKYFYLIFSEPELLNLDEWVLNTEAHPFKRPRRSTS